MAVEDPQFTMPILAAVQPNWRPWEEAEDSRFDRKNPRKRALREGEATVDVEGEAAEREERFIAYRARMAPQLRLAYDAGYFYRTNKQMLTEFMLMDPSHPHPPTIPSVFYNNFQPPPENPALKEMSQ